VSWTLPFKISSPIMRHEAVRSGARVLLRAVEVEYWNED